MSASSPRSPRLRGGALVSAGALTLALVALGRATREEPAGRTPAPRWATVSAAGFDGEARAERSRWRGPEGALAPAVGSYAEVLASSVPGATRTRAAVLLGLAVAEAPAGSPAEATAIEALVLLLTAREAPPSRAETGAALVAARVLGEVAGREDLEPLLTRRLADLAAGDEPHPDLSTRVECAAAALRGPRDPRVIPFLLAVLRAGTPDEVKSPGTWPRVTTLAWVKTRAADALAAALGTENRFRPDGSWEHQGREADRLEALVSAPADGR